MTRSILFDLDGVLVDSWHVAAAAFLGAAAALGLDGTAAIGGFQRRLGMPLDRIRCELGFPAAFSGLFLDEARRLDHQAVPFAGVSDMLAGLRSAGWRIGIVTGKDSPRARTILAATGLAPFVDALIGGDTAPRGKPHPEPLWMCEALLGVDAAAGYVGDTVIDAEAARRAGRPFFHAVWDPACHRDRGAAAGDGSPTLRVVDRGIPVAGTGACVTVDSPAELLRVLTASTRIVCHG